MSSSEQIARKIALPDWRHVPGRNQRHPEGFLDHILTHVPDMQSGERLEGSVAWHYAIRLMRTSFYWEAHEVLEAIWLSLPQNSRKKHLVQGMIHLTNAALKRRMGKQNAEKRLLERAGEHIDRAFQGREGEPVLELLREDLPELIGCDCVPTNRA